MTVEEDHLFDEVSKLQTSDFNCFTLLEFILTHCTKVSEFSAIFFTRLT